MKKKDIRVSVYRRANRKYYQAKFRLSCGEWTERSTKTTNRADKWLEGCVREGSLKEETILSYSRSISGIKRIKRSKKLLMELLKEAVAE